MKKIIKKYGSSFIITFSSEDMKIYGLKSGDVIDMEIMKIDSKNIDSKSAEPKDTFDLDLDMEDI